MSFTFHSNYPVANQDPLTTACEYTTESWSPVNTKPIQLGPKPIDTSQDCLPSSSPSATPIDIHTKIQDLSSSNPAVYFVSSSSDSTDSSFICSAIRILSSARTVELYLSGEYSGTFRGEPITATPSPTEPPLFSIHIDLEEKCLPQRNRYLLIKFFIPKKPAAFQDTLTLHHLVIQGNIHMSQPAEASVTASAPPSSTLAKPGFHPNPSETQHPSSTVASDQRPMSVSSIDLEKVKEMLGQVQLDSLPQGAKDLMRTMEMQSRVKGAMSFGGPTIGGLPHQLSSLPSLTPTSSSLPTPAPVTSTDAESEYITKADLMKMEERIMARVEERFLQMEQRILSTFMDMKTKNAVKE
ncbi:hypothetical protein BG011_007749 [Mortierella polycephala]|uniref:Uncharacterized protein n=1 Tax=Mortierella polycephala TaxID=41804 RepID=A0A9P6TY67_9FUNG|nr:hypothetical protein BG011_007749 [Mortierella polycephala]